MRDLEDFATPDPRPIFPDADSLPVFFENNLIDPARVVKVFRNDPQGNIRIFYYQYLKLCFDIESVDFEGYINRIQQIINNPDYKFVFYQDDDPQLFSDLQFKSLLTQFFGILGQGNTTVDEALSKYPILDTVMVYFYRAILILTGKTQSLDSYIDRDELFNFLCQEFGVQISVHDKCIKFVETDIFVYEEEPQQVFMAYMDYDKTNSNQISPQKQQYQYQPEQSYNQTQNQSQYVPSVSIGANIISHKNQQPIISSSSRREKTEMNQSYISCDFVDYTSANALISQNSLNNSGTLERNNNVYISGKAEQNTPIETPLINSNKYQLHNVFSQQNEPKTEVYKPQSNGYTSFEEKKVVYSSGLGQFGVSKIEPSYDRPFVPQIPKYVEPFHKKQFEKYSSPSEFDSMPSNLGIQHKNQPQSSFTPYHPPSTVDTYRTKQSSYTSNYSQPNKLTDDKPPYSQLQTELPWIKPPSQANTYFQDIKPPSSQKSNGLQVNQSNQYVGPSVGQSTKNPFNLNVSLEFTNSFTMKAMSEPFKTEVRIIRQRARNYRDSLIGFIK